MELTIEDTVINGKDAKLQYLTKGKYPTRDILYSLVGKLLMRDADVKTANSVKIRGLKSLMETHHSLDLKVTHLLILGYTLDKRCIEQALIGLAKYTAYGIGEKMLNEEEEGYLTELYEELKGAYINPNVSHVCLYVTDPVGKYSKAYYDLVKENRGYTKLDLVTNDALKNDYVTM